MNVLDHGKLHQKYFEEMTRIPHGSYHEEKYADYLEAFAREHGFEYVRDHVSNVIIYKPASEGYEEHGPVILQAHTDMVCEKNEDCSHDFTSDPLDLYLEDGILRARGTTLGADDGTGCSYMLAVLASDLPHPLLECVFTVQEEVGLKGAFELKPEYFRGKRYVNLDFGGRGIGTCTTSAGGEMIDFRKPVSFSEKETAAYRIFVTGLCGGHSGSCISKGYANALKAAGRLLRAVRTLGPVELCRLHGGEKSNAIPRECEAVFVSAADEKELRRVFEDMAAKIRNEYRTMEPGMELILEPCRAGRVLSADTSDELIRLLALLPTGVRHMSAEIPGLPSASENLAAVRTEGDYVEIRYSLRAEKMSLRDEMEEELLALAAVSGMTPDIYSRYPSWEFNPDSAMRTVLTRLYKEQRGKEMELLATHGGLECGVFCGMIPGLDVVTLGPETDGAHTPKEQMNMESFDRTFDLLCSFLKEL